MPLRNIREERKKLGVGVRRSPRTLTLIFLLVIVVILIIALARVG
jgi:hypothetical protein